MAFSPFKKSSKCLITDDLFLKVTWEDGKSPEDDNELLGVIEGLDSSYLPEGQLPIEETLPYLSFLQAETLFQELLRVYGRFQLKRVAIAHLEGKEVVTEGEVFTSPFVIDSNYQNLLVPLIQAILTDRAFNTYSYQEKREYFENQIYPAYKVSLGIADSALPLFPEEGEVVRQASSVNPLSAPVVSPSKPLQGETIKPKAVKRLSLVVAITVLLTLFSCGISVILWLRLSQQSEQVLYLYQELTETQTVVSTEHQIDAFGRFFLPNYYSGNKDALTDFLSDGDAKYTQPSNGTLQSAVLESVTYDSDTKTYQVTYVVSVKQDDNTSSRRLNFTVKASKNSRYGYVITTEPTETSYFDN